MRAHPELPRDPHPHSRTPSAAPRYELDPPFEWSPTTLVVGAAGLVLVLVVALFPGAAVDVADWIAELA